MRAEVVTHLNAKPIKHPLSVTTHSIIQLVKKRENKIVPQLASKYSVKDFLKVIFVCTLSLYCITMVLCGHFCYSAGAAGAQEVERLVH